MSDLQSVFLFWKNIHKFYSNFIDNNHIKIFDEIFFDSILKFESYKADCLFKKMCHCLNDAHTNVYNKRRIRPKNYGINVKCHESNFLVIGTSYSLSEKIPLGSKVLKINNKILSEVIDDNLKNFSYSRLDHGISRTLKFIFSDQYSKNPTITFTDKNNNEKSIQVNELYNASEFSLDGSIPSFTSKENVFNKHVSYIYLSSFSNENEIYNILKEFKKLRSVSKLIIDIRGNCGGNGLLAIKLLASFSNKKLDGPYWRTLSFNAFHTAWFHNMDPKQNLANNSDWYMGKSESVFPDMSVSVNKICILIDCETISAAEDFLLYARQLDNCTLIGETTAGSSGLPINLDLGANYWCQITVKHDFINQPNDFIRVGIAPDYIVHHTTDLLSQGIDSPLQFAFDFP